MKIIVHRGTHEIGGNCVELCSSSGERLIVDLGLPLTEEWSGKRVHNTSGALAAGLLPDIPGLYVGQEKPRPMAVILSHLHADHAGLINHVHPDVPIHLGTKAGELLRTVASVAGQAMPVGEQFEAYRDGERLYVGPFVITPYFMDHSAYDSYAFLIECDGKRLFYSGDFRGHGRKKRSFEELLRHPPEKIDLLLMEGTCLGGDIDHCISEENTEQNLIAALFENDGHALIAYSPQNLDRHVSLIKAAHKAHRKLWLDTYSALCHETYIRLGEKLPPLGRGAGEIGVMLGDEAWLKRPAYADFKAKLLKNSAANFPTALKEPSLIVWRYGLAKQLTKHREALMGGTFIWSMWSGYLEGNEAVAKIMEDCGLELRKIHSSGHADTPTLKAFFEALSPSFMVPLHTADPERFREIIPADRIHFLADTEVYDL